MKGTNLAFRSSMAPTAAPTARALAVLVSKPDSV